MSNEINPTGTQETSMTAYAIARNLVGFASTSLRVKISQIEGGYAWVTTADLLDAGTKLTLDVAQLEPETEVYEMMFKTGTVIFA